jgi:inorganic triphosphatase YgiF
MRLQDNLEIELKLTVTGDDPDALLDEVARLDGLGPLRLGPAEDHRLRDIYWDLPDGGLHALKLSLRLRQIDDRLVFTAKGGTSHSEGLFRRYELEVPATRENWAAVRAALAGEGAELGGDDSGDGPSAWLRGAGLVPTQDRTTRRSAKYAFAGAHGNERVAELALDRTRFNFGTMAVDYWEIEVEQLNGHEEAPRRLGQALLERYHDRLELSTMGKYSRGLAIERELREAGRL